MPVPNEIDSSHILSAEEILAISYLQMRYATQIKQSATELAETIGLDEAATLQLVGRLAVSVEEQRIAFDERKNISDLFKQLTRSLGGSALEGDDEPLARLDIFVVKPSGALNKTVAEQVAPETDEDTSGNEIKNWLKHIAGEDGVDKFNALTTEQRAELALEICNLYIALRINKLDKVAKFKRAAILSDMIKGMNIDEVTVSYGMKKSEVRVVLNRAADNISKRVNSEKIMELINKTAGVESVA